MTVPRPDWLLAGHPDVPRGDHQEPGPGAEQAEGEDQPAGGGEGGTAQPEPGGQRTAQTASDQAGAGTQPTLPPHVAACPASNWETSSRDRSSPGFSSSSVAARGAPGPREGAHQAAGALRGGDAPLQGGAGASAGGDGGETPGHDGGGSAGEGGGEETPHDGRVIVPKYGPAILSEHLDFSI